MNRRVQAAEAAVFDAARLMTESGLTARLQELVQDVWGSNLARHEPEERGDTSKSLGFQCSENLRELAVRMINGGELIEPQDAWNIEGLQVSTPKGVLTLTLPGLQVVPMKVPYAQGRLPQWDNFPSWESASRIRQEIAAENTRIIGGSPHQDPDQGELEISGDAPIGVLRRMMMLWAGEPDDSSTSAWLTVPVEWTTANFAAVTPLWRDEPGSTPSQPRRKPTPDGPAFDKRPTAEPEVTLKPRPAIEGEA